MTRPQELLISETFKTKSGHSVTIHNLPTILDSQTAEVVGYSMGVSGAIGALLKRAEANGLTEIQFDPALILPPRQADPVARELRRAMLSRGLTGAAIARALGVKPPLVSRWLSPDYHEHSLSTIRRIADVLDMDVEVKLKPRAG